MKPYRYCDCRRLLLGAQCCVCETEREGPKLIMKGDVNEPGSIRSQKMAAALASSPYGQAVLQPEI